MAFESWHIRNHDKKNYVIKSNQNKGKGRETREREREKFLLHSDNYSVEESKLLYSKRSVSQDIIHIYSTRHIAR